MNTIEEQISDLDDRIMEITQTGQQTENKMKKQERNIRDLLYNINLANLYVTGIPKGEGKEKGTECIFQ